MTWQGKPHGIKALLGELGKELAMRRKVWQAVKDPVTGRHVFAVMDRQLRYDRLEAALALLVHLSEKSDLSIDLGPPEKEPVNGVQQSLF